MSKNEGKQWTVQEAWAHALTTDRLVMEVRRLAENIRHLEPNWRQAVLLEAARRLDEELP